MSNTPEIWSDASTADLAVILVDARQNYPDANAATAIWCICQAFAIVLAVNKMDLVNYDQAVFDQIVADYGTFATKIGIKDFRQFHFGVGR